MDGNRENNWYDDEITQAILHKKYLHEGEKTFDDLVNRVSSIYSEDIREDVKNALYNADLCPAGRTLYAAGRKGKEKLTLSNCFINDVCDDTLEDISRLDASSNTFIKQYGYAFSSVDCDEDCIYIGGKDDNNFVINKIDTTKNMELSQAKYYVEYNDGTRYLNNKKGVVFFDECIPVTAFGDQRLNAATLLAFVNRVTLKVVDLIGKPG